MSADDDYGRIHGPLVRRLSDWDEELLERTAEEHGTPLYVVDLDRVRENYRRFDDAFPEARVMYAAKANTGRAVLSAVMDAGAEIECAARGELQRAIDAGADPNSLRYTAVNPPAVDLEYAAGLAAEHPGLTVTAGARDTFDRLAELGFDGRVSIRVNPGIGTGHHEKVATGKDAKFGVPAAEVPAVAREVAAEFDLVGLHAHVGSGVLRDDLDDHCRALSTVADVAREVGDAVGGLEFVDFGGGFGVPYRPETEPLDLSVVADRVRAAVGELDARVELEPGRYVAADAATILTRVNTVKRTPEATVVGVDASLATLVRPAMFDAYHAIRNLSGSDREAEPVSVGGPCCTSADVFCTDRPLAQPERGDLLAVGNAGAYGYELASRFHSQPLPGEVAVEDGDTRVTREAETLGDVTRLEKT
ncbi:diaminopimelate decarboxylase [Halobaculum sp. MBLA0143]|uniref:diaminopimelate decarboxylase n=1 Tax=Halobaculum sp. MBLA0143 TaxID=3079933 RepID=UPI0035248F07